MSTPRAHAHSAPSELDRERAAINVLTYAASTVPAESRRTLVERLLADGAWSALGWLTDSSNHRGELGPAARKATQVISSPRWGRAVLSRIEADTDAGVRFLTRTDADWPAQLDDLAHLAPIGLWVRGTLPTLTEGAVSIVGSRKLSVEGHSKIDRLVVGLPVPVISGLAIGADETAHRAALLHGVPTVAVLPSGVDHPYPHINRSLADRIVTNGGAVLSETPPGVSPARFRFLDRNRIIAALGSGSLIVEAAATSGTMSEANHAHRLGRSIAAIPGTPGADQLIASGTAFAFLSTADLDALHHLDLTAS